MCGPAPVGAPRRARTRTTPSHPPHLEDPVDAAVTAWLLAQLGTTTNMADLETRYARLGSARAVALEVLRQRLADLRAQPSSVTVSSVVGVSYTENIKAYERQIASLEAGEPTAPDDPPCASPGGVGLFILRARDRR